MTKEFKNLSEKELSYFDNRHGIVGKTIAHERAEIAKPEKFFDWIMGGNQLMDNKPKRNIKAKF